MNCLELITQANEDEFVNYKCEPDNREIGSVLKKAFDKDLKAKIANLSSAELKTYLRDGFVMIGDIKIEPGWLKVEKVFNEKYTADKDFACATSEVAAVMLNTVTNEKLQFLATAREITSKIQKQRKALGLQIEDKIDVYFSHELAAESNSLLHQLTQNQDGMDKLRQTLKSFSGVSEMRGEQEVISKISYEHPHQEGDIMHLTICRASQEA